MASELNKVKIRHSLRERLLLAFIAISGFAVVAAVVGNYAFYALGKALHQVTEESVPPAIATLELAQSSERIVAAGPALLAVTSDDEFKTESAALDRELKTAEALLDKLPGQGLTAEKLIQFRLIFRVVSDNLESLKTAVQTRIAASDRKAALVSQTFEAYNDFRTIWTPKFNELKAQIVSLQRVLDAAGNAPEARMAAVGRLNDAIRDLAPLEQMQQEAANVFQALVRAASATTPAALEAIRKDTDQSVRHIDDLVSGLDPDLSFELIVPISKLRTNAVSQSGVIAARDAELKAIQEGRRLTVENSALSAQLSSAVALLVAASKEGIAAATAQTKTVQNFGRLGLAAAVALSLISSILIGWLYVGRNVVARLTLLSDGMGALAGGRRDIAIPTAGNDEITAMARAVEVFRDNAIALDELLAERKQTAAQLEKIVEDRTAELHRRESELRVTLDNMAHAVVMFDSRLQLTAWNRQFSALLELPDAFLNSKPHFTEYIRYLAERGEYGAVDVESEVRRLMARVKEHFISERTRPDGKVLEIRHNPLPGGGTVIIYTDITERKHYEETLTAARDQAEAMNRTKSSFLANMSHELRTPLNAIIGYSEILQEDVADLGRDNLVPDLKKIEGSGRHLLGLINDILDLSKVEAGRMDIFLEDVEIVPLLEEVRAIIVPLAEKGRNAVEYRLADNLGSMYTDRTKLKQSLLNILSNANKFTENGRVTLVAERIQNGRSAVRFAISDTGIGMTEEQLGRLFQAFSQAATTTSQKYGGTGLGLVITRNFCQLLGGDVTVASKPGEGSTFTITLPDRSATQPHFKSIDAPQIAGEVNNATTVLVVDDDPAARDLLTANLRGAGYHLIHAASGIEALNLARMTRPDAITLDVLMPKPDGWDVLTALKADAQLRDIPVIMVTVLSERGIGLSLGAVEVLTKPVDRAQLTALMHSLLRREGPVLLVEDDASARELIWQSIEKMGLAVEEAANGRQALTWLSAHPAPAMILLDLVMPEMDGFEVLDALAARADWRDIPVVVITAKQLTGAERERLLRQAQKIIAKGTTSRLDIAAAVSEAVRRRSVRMPAGANA